jgi:protein-disulfide isomerase
MSQKEKVPRKQAREEARQKAKAVMEETRRKEKRNKMFFQGGIIVGVLAVVSIIGLLIANQPQPVPQANPANMISGGVVLTGNQQVVPSAAIPEGGEATATPLTDDKVHVDIYVDYLCPFCKLFEEVQKETIMSYMENYPVEFEFHPLGMISEYSAVSANAAACVASLEPALWWDANNALYDFQPEEAKGAQFTKKQSINYILETAWVNTPVSEEVKQCVKDTRYYDSVMFASATALSDVLPNTNGVKLQSTPTVLIDGVKFEGNWRDNTTSLSQAIDQALEAKGLK